MTILIDQKLLKVPLRPNSESMRHYLRPRAKSRTHFDHGQTEEPSLFILEPLVHLIGVWSVDVGLLHQWESNACRDYPVNRLIMR